MMANQKILVRLLFLIGTLSGLRGVDAWVTFQPTSKCLQRQRKAAPPKLSGSSSYFKHHNGPLWLSSSSRNDNPKTATPSTIGSGSDRHALAKFAKGLIATLSMAGVLFLSPPQLSPRQQQQQPFWAPPASHAVSTLVLAEEESTVSEGIAVLNEVWTLIDKYFIDRTFGGQDWYNMHDKYEEKINKLNSDSKNYNNDVMKLITEMVASLGDKYSRILDVQQYAAIQKFDLIGVGVTLMPNQNKEIIVGSPPVPKSASDRAGLQVGDRVLAINGVPTEGRTAFDIIDQIAENPNAKSVTMTIGRKQSQVIDDVTMDRAFQEVKDPIRYKISETRSDGTKVGFVRILEFNAIVKTKLEDALRALEAEGANAYVLDLRMNTGGAFQSAVEIASLFMQDRIATYVVDSSGAEIPFKTPKSRLAIDKEDPMVLWVDGASASASEVLAGALHDNCRAAIMGDKSFGKGLIQAVYGLKNGAGLVLTVARYLTPNGSEIQGIGITPDIKGGVPLPIPGLSTDTSRVDFKEIANRLDPTMCTVPEAKGAR